MFVHFIGADVFLHVLYFVDKYVISALYLRCRFYSLGKINDFVI